MPTDNERDEERIEAALEGRMAARKGQTKENCPYSLGTTLHRFWMEGLKNELISQLGKIEKREIQT